MTRCRAALAVLLVGLMFAAGWSAGAGAIQLRLPAEAGALAAPAVNSTPAMWKLETGKATVYFLGSFHILPPGETWREDPRIDAAMTRSRAVVFETDLDELDKPETADILVRRATLPDGQTLRNVLSPATYGLLQATAAKFGMDPAAMERMKPWLAASGLLVGYMATKGGGPDDGVDSRLTREARAAGKAVVALETVEQQFTILDGLSAHDPDLLITDMVRFVDESTGLLESMITAWRTGDTEAIDRILREDLDRHEGAYDRFLTDRNAAWVPRIETLMEQGGTVFVVVGAGHLVGDKSLIAMLRSKGYAVERY